ncbi:MAG: 2Fe-2S iron-sulfur cluster-binding protein [Sulfuritalea sp.]|nr:2Fe-2S iron-sulfur cluster-binding protein [Sulfuritalea sp.]
MAYFSVTIEDTCETYRNSDRNTVLEGMAALGRKGIPLGCCGGGCGVCKIEIVSGSYRKRVMSRAHVSIEDEAANRVLACRVWPTSDLRLRVIGKIARNVCRNVAAAAAAQTAAPG